MSETRASEQVRYLTPRELADLADEVRTESHATIADHLGVSRSAVSRALREAQTRDVSLLRRILGLYGIDVAETRTYRVDR